MLRIIIVVLIAVVALTALAQLRSSGLRWESVSSELPTFTLGTPGDDEEPGVEITMREGYVYVKTDHMVGVKVVNVLGNPVSEAVLEAGTSRLQLHKRGIYVVRVGKTARRVKVN